MTGMRWLAAVAGFALLAGVPASGAEAARAKTGVKAKKARHAPRRVVRRRPAVIAPIIFPPVFVPSPPVDVEPSATYAPAPSYARYRWLDDADAMLGAIAGSSPDVTFAVGRDARFAWIFDDGGVAIAEPLSQFERRWYFFEPDVTVPFLVRDAGRSFGFDRGRLAVVYDANGTARDGRPGEQEERDAADLLDRGRRLWFAARAPAPLPPREQLSGWSLRFDFGGDFGDWRENGGWRAYRNGVDDGQRRGRDDRYRREREERRARGGRGRGVAGASDASSRAAGDARGAFGRGPAEATRPTPPAARPPASGGAASTPADRPDGFARDRLQPARDRPARRDERPDTSVPPVAVEAPPAPERARHREPDAPPVPPRAAEPERAPPRAREPAPVAAPAPPPEPAAPPPRPERPPTPRQAEPANAEKPE